MKKFGCKICSSPHFVERDGKLYCASCGAVFAINEESFEQRDLRIKYLSRLDTAEGFLRVSPPKFEEAEDYYRDFIKQYPDNSDGYWGLVRAKYGIKYENDASGRKVPSCYKSSYEDFKKDPDFCTAIKLAESEPLRKRYMSEAETIAKICKEWRAEAQKLTYDIFISFKATEDGTGYSTNDLNEMKQLYAYLLDMGYSVFFSPMSMRRYSSENFEPYIFNALQTAKVMIVYGSKPEYFTSTWVENEWTRFLRMIDRGEKKKGSCIIACNGFNPKELPHLLRNIQAIDASNSNRNFYNDVLNNIKKVMSDDDTSAQTMIKQEEITDIIRRYEEETNQNKIRNAVKNKTESLEKNITAFRDRIDDFVESITNYRRNREEDRAYPITVWVLLAVVALLSVFKLRVLCIVAFLLGIILLFATSRFMISKRFSSLRENSPKAVRIAFLIALIALVFGGFRLFCQVGIVDNLIIDGKLIRSYVDEETVTVPEGVETVGSYAFAGKSGIFGQKIKTIVLPDSLRKIEFAAFGNCRSLEEIYLDNDGLEEKATAAFLNCENFKRIYLYGGGGLNLSRNGFLSSGGTELKTIEVYEYNDQTKSFPSSPMLTIDTR